MNDFLKEFGFTEYEAKVYEALTRLNSAKASKIAKYSGVPKNKVYECLIKLVENNFVSSLNVTPQEYKIRDLQQFQEIVDKKKNKLTELQQKIAEISENLQKRSFEIKESAVVFKGKKKIIQMLKEATTKTKEYQYTFGGNLVFDYQSAYHIKNAIVRGVKFKFLVHYDPKRKKAYKNWEKIGVQIRFYPKEEQKSIRFSTFDGKECRITIGKPEIAQEEDYLSFWIESPAFSLMLKDQFLEMWKKGQKSFLP